MILVECFRRWYLWSRKVNQHLAVLMLIAYCLCVSAWKWNTCLSQGHKFPHSTAPEWAYHEISRCVWTVIVIVCLSLLRPTIGYALYAFHYSHIFGRLVDFVNFRYVDIGSRIKKMRRIPFLNNKFAECVGLMVWLKHGLLSKCTIWNWMLWKCRLIKWRTQFVIFVCSAAAAAAYYSQQL